MLNEEQLKTLEEMGGNFFNIQDCAIVLQVSPTELKELIKDNNTEEHKRYHKGRLLNELELRKSIIQLAKRGSNPAQKMLLDILLQNKVANI